MTSSKAWFTAVVVATFMTPFTGHATERTIAAAAVARNGHQMRMPMQVPAPTIPAPGCAAIGPVKVFCSAEVGDASKDGRLLVEALDDPWRSAAAGATFVVGRIKDSELPLVVEDSLSTRVTASLQNVTDSDLASATGRGEAHERQGIAAFSAINTMQEGAPKPEFLAQEGAAAWNAEYGKANSRNAVLFAFDPPVTAFGAWFGDLETRSDHKGTTAVLRLFHTKEQSMSFSIPIASSTADQDTCRQEVMGCGNKTTRWIGFVANAVCTVSAMLVVVGDDDPRDVRDGKLEHLGFIGPTVAFRTEPSAAEVADQGPCLPLRLVLPLLSSVSSEHPLGGSFSAESPDKWLR